MAEAKKEKSSKKSNSDAQKTSRGVRRAKRCPEG